MRPFRLLPWLALPWVVHCGDGAPFSDEQQNGAIRVAEGSWTTTDGSTRLEICEDKSTSISRDGFTTWQVASGGRGHRVADKEGCMGHPSLASAALVATLSRGSDPPLTLHGTMDCGSEDRDLTPPFQATLSDGGEHHLWVEIASSGALTIRGAGPPLSAPFGPKGAAHCP